MLTKNKKEINWKPIIKKFVAVVGEKGVVQRKEELLTYECDGLTSYKQRQYYPEAQNKYQKLSKFAINIPFHLLLEVQEQVYLVGLYQRKIPF